MPAKKFIVPFASTGDKTAVPNTLQPDGSVSYAQGFGPDYALDKVANPVTAKDVPRNQTNQLYFDLTEAVGEQQLYGLALWGSDRAPYPINSRVYHSAKLWRSNIDNNSGTPGVSADWVDVSSPLTQTAGDTRYAQRSNNLSDLTSAATARANLGVSDAVDGGVQGAYSGLKLTTTGISALVNVTANSLCLKDVDNRQKVVNSLSVSPSMSASGVNGLDTGTSAASTWYSVWVIWNGVTVSGLLSLSTTSPTMPSGYTHKARVGRVRTDATGNKFPLRVVQVGVQVRYAPLAGSNTAALPVIAQGVQAAGTAYATGNFVPDTAGVIHGICAPDATFRSAVGPSSGVYDLFYITSGAGTPLSNSVFFALLLESTNIYGFQSGAASRTLVYGWEDNL